MEPRRKSRGENMEPRRKSKEENMEPRRKSRGEKNQNIELRRIKKEIKR